MHTATRLALPVIDRVRRINPDARLVAYGLYAPLNDALLAGARHPTDLGGEFEEDLVKAARTAGAGGAASAEGSGADSSVEFRVPLRERACRRCRSTRPCRTATSAERSATRRRAAAASTAAAIARSCRSTTVASGSFPPTSSSPMRARRSPRAPATSRSAIRTSSTASGTRARSSSGSRASVPGVTYDVTIKVEHLLAACRRAAAAAETRAARSSRAPSKRSTTRCSRGSRRGTRVRDFERAVALCRARRTTAVADLRRVHALDDDRGISGAAARDRAARARGSRGADPVRDPAAGAAGIPHAGARGHRASSPARSIRCRSRIPGVTPIPAWTRLQDADRRASSACG